MRRDADLRRDVSQEIHEMVRRIVDRLLTELPELARQGGDVDVGAGERQLLMPQAVQARYPGIWVPTARAEAEEAVEAARHVRAVVRAVLSEETPGAAGRPAHTRI